MPKKVIKEIICVKCGSSKTLPSWKAATQKYCSISCAKLGSGNGRFRHGEVATKEYIAWTNMKARVIRGTEHNFVYYKGKGIKVCDQWASSFETFLEDMGYAPSPKHEIDRINVDGHYEPSNCRWVSKHTQMNNTTRNVSITYDGKTMHLREWARELGIYPSLISKRMKKGLPVEKVLSTHHLSSDHSSRK